MAKRYIHPGARPKTATRTGTNSDCKDSQRTLDDIIKEQGNDVFTVILQAESSNSFNLPFEEVQNEESEKGVHEFKLPFGDKDLRKLMMWFREIGWKDQDAMLRFPPDLSKDNRKRVHEIAQSYGLGTSSAGFGERRCISVYSVEHATLGVGKIYLTKEEREKANEIWRLVKQEGDEYKKFSRNEIEEMVLVNKLDPSLEELWKKRESLLEEDIKEKCKISDEKDITIPSEQ